MKFSILFAVLLPCSLGIAADSSALIESLPGLRKQAYAKTKELREGSTAAMVDAGARIRDLLLPSLVKLEAELENETVEKTEKVIRRDLEAVARDAFIRGNAEGYGGTIVRVDEAFTVVSHIEDRISYTVWQLMREDENFDFEGWLKRWRKEIE